MPEPLPDEVFAQHLVKAGFATAEQLEAARALQAERERESVIIPLAEALVRAGVITPQQRELVEEKLKAGPAGEVQQLGQFKLLRKLGEGGMGVVYLAEDVMLSRKVALKVLPKQFSSDPERLARFKREARAAGWLNHVNIVTAFDIGEDLGNHFFVMEYCEGETLDARLERDKRLPEKAVAVIALQVAQGLQYAHGHGIIHRDVKPGNIFLTRDGVAKVLDLGLSKDVAQGAQSFETLSGVVLGTPHYISPEQARGAKDVDNRSDIYSLGATMYHLVTGETPFHAPDAAAVILMHMAKQLPDPRDICPEISEGMVHVITKAMAKEPEDRYATMAEMAEDLEQVRDGQMPVSPAVDPAHSSVARRRGPSTPRSGEPEEGSAPPSGLEAPPSHQRGRAPHARQREPARPPVRSPREARAEAPGGPRSRALLYVGGATAVGILVVAFVLSTQTGSPGPDETSLRDLAEKKRAAQEERLRAEAARIEEERRKLEADRRKLEDERRKAEGKWAGPETPRTEAAPLRVQPASQPSALPKELKLDLGGGIAMELVLVPAGEFEMGSNEGGPEERPVHKVRISKPFYIGKYDVTVAQFRRFVETTGYETECERGGSKGWTVKGGKWREIEGANWRNPGFEQTPDHPVVVVTWADAQAFTVWLSKLSGRDAHLPTEAQWEYAARGPQSLKYPWGDTWDGTRANHGDVSLRNAGFTQWGCSGDNDGYAFTSPIGAYKNASWCGAYDMAGNVWQWCADWFNDKYYAESPPVDPKGPASGVGRVLRGGVWLSFASDCRSARRHSYYPYGKDSDVGFRVVVEGSQAAAGAQPTAEAEVQQTKGVPGVPASAAETTALERPAQGTPAGKPGIGAWPLHDGKEPVADYARRVGLPATEVLALGGGVKMEFLLVPAGEFDMGEKGIVEPVHRVRISKPFYMARYETTVAQFRAFANATKYRTEAETTNVGAIHADGRWVGVPGTNWRNPRFPQEDNYPAGVITWNDAQEFCKWVTRMTRREVCLPTDAQWEYACRAGTTTVYNTGDKESDLEEAAWTNTNSGMRNHAVGQKKANAWGLCDMHGNVWEWVQDYYSDKYYAESPLVDPKGPAVGSPRVFRGCCWYETTSQCRSAHRGGFDPTHRFVTIGFRAALEAPQAATGAQPRVEAELADYRKRVEAAWPGLGTKLTLGPTGFALDLTNCKQVGDLTPLGDMPLASLNLQGCVQVSDLTPLRGMPLSSLGLWGCARVRDLSPLEGMPLASLNLNECTQVRDLRPLRGMPLASLVIGAYLVPNAQVSDLTPLQGMRLASLEVRCCPVEGLAPLQGMPLNRLVIRCCRRIKDFRPLAGMKLTLVELADNSISDLTPLQGMPLTYLDVWACEQVKDLTPLAGMKLSHLNLGFTKVRDLTPLKGMPVTWLNLQGCREVKDLSPLTGMGLTCLEMMEAGVADIAPLEGMNLETLRFTPKNITKGLGDIRNMKSLKAISPEVNGWNPLPPAEFWRKYDAGEFNK